MVKVSVIVPVFNVEKYLRKCVDSIINQTLEDIEIILVDDGSPDNCPQICDEYAEKDSRIKVIHQQNSGQSKARNVGMEVAKGEYIGFVDSDDYIESDMYECLYNIAVNNNVDVVSSACYRNIGDIQSILGFSFIKNTIIIKEHIKELVCNCMTNKVIWFTWKSIFRKKMLVDNGIKFPDGINYGEDPIFNLDAYMNSDKIYYFDKPLYHYVFRENSTCTVKYKNNFSEKLQKKYLSIIDRFKKYNIEEYEMSMFTHCMRSHIPSLLKNEKNHKCSLKIKIAELMQIRNSVNVDEAFRNISIMKIVNFSKPENLILFLKNIKRFILHIPMLIKVFLLKHKLYFILALINR